MKTLYLTFFLFCCTLLHAQEICDNGIDDDGDLAIDLLDSDCSCSGGISSIVADFEDNTCCPTSLTFGGPGDGYYCINQEWDFASGATTDYFNTCNFVGGGFVPMVPMPIPSGNGAIAFATLSDGYNEGIARCLDCTLIAGETYDISFFAGFNSLFGISSSSPVEFAIYGKTDCLNIPSTAGFNCLEGQGWTELGTFTAVGNNGTWTLVTGTFSPPFDVVALAFSKSCDFVAGPNHSSNTVEYHFLDALEITGNLVGPNCGPPPPQINASLVGDCINGYTLNVAPASALSYQWYLNGIAIAGATTNPWDISPVVAGEYEVLATFADGTCAISDPIIFDPDQESLNIDATLSSPSCFGDTDGSIALMIDSPNTPYTINWNTGSNNSTLDNIGGGNYAVTVTDANGCTGTFMTTLPEPSELVVAVNIVQPVGPLGGIVSLLPSGGVPPFQYQWSNGLTGQVETDLAPGTYTITITDANGCQDVVVVEIEDPFSVDVFVSPEECLGACDGSIEIIPIGGLPPYSYAWSNGASSDVEENLCAGDYTITITDSNGVSLEEEGTVGPGAQFFLTIVDVGFRCTNQETTDLDLSVVAGQPPYSFVWSNGAISEDLAGVSNGIYSVVVTDALGCESTASFEVLPVEELALTSLVTNISCSTPQGSINLIVTEGVAPFTFNWDNGATSAQILNLLAGTYSVTVTDANGCTLEESITLEEQAQISLTANLTDVSCTGDTDGSIDLMINGGTAPFTTNWSNGQSTEDLNNLSAGTYSVNVTDADGCIVFGTYTVGTISTLDNQVNVVDPSCPSSMDGAITVTPMSNALPLSFNWSIAGSTSTLENLGAGDYALTITDGLGCDYTFAYELEEPSLFEIDSMVTPSLCFEDSSAAITVIPLAAGNFTGLWSTGEVGLTINELGAGDYVVTVTSEADCEQVYSFTISNNPPIEALVNETQPTCGDSNGTLSLTVSGGQAPLTVNWSTGDTGTELTDIPSGDYNYTVTDALGCTLDGTISLAEDASVNIGSTVTQPTCPGDTNGSIELALTGGAPPYTITWSTGENGTSLSGLNAGNYSVVVQDANLCTVEQDFSLVEASNLSLDATIDSVICFGGSSGAITIDAVSNTGNLVYQWSNGSMTPSITGLGADTYALTITDDLGCAYLSDYEINEPPLFEIDSLIILNACVGENAASIELLPITPGTYDVTWSNGQIGLANTNLFAGTYTAEVTNAAGCTQSYAFTLADEVPALSSSLNPVPLSCGFDNGSLSVVVDGGNPPYTYAWNTGATGDFIENLAAGVYEVAVTDAEGCSTTLQQELLPSTALDLSSIVVNPTCNGEPSGSIELSPSAGTAPYTITWSNGASGTNLTNVTAGTYEATITDAIGCALIESFVLTEPPILTLTTDTEAAACFGDFGTASVLPDGGTPPYSISWSSGDSDFSISQGAGNYTFTLSDANACNTTGEVEITEPPLFEIDSLITLNACFGGSDASIELLPITPGTYNVNWSNGPTGLVNDGLNAGAYTALVTNAAGCAQSYTFQVADEIPPLMATLNVGDPNCGLDNGSLSVDAEGGTLPYSYTWNTSATQDLLVDLAPGVYEVLVTDAEGCSTTLEQELLPSTPLGLNSVVLDPACNGEPIGNIELTINSGTAPFTVTWSNGAIGTTLSGINAGTYIATITDAVGCELLDTFGLTEPPALTLATDMLDAPCFGDLGTASVAPDGGTAPYAIIWSTGDTDFLINQGAGLYSFVLSDANDCTITGEVEITEPSLLEGSITNLEDPTTGQNDGVISAAATGGTAPYTYTWSNGNTGATITGLAAGDYTVTITDENGCTVILDATLMLEELAVAFTIMDNGCFGECQGQIELTITGGLPPYGIVWSDGQTGATALDLCADTYQVTVSDDNGSIVLLEDLTISAPPALVLDESISPVSCIAANDGAVLTEVGGGVEPYSYAWSNGQNGADLTQVAAGEYTLLLTDANDCAFTAAFSIPDYIPISVDFETEVTNCTWDEFQLALVPPIATEVEYLLNGEPVEIGGVGIVTALAAGNYSFSYEDGNGCEVSIADFDLMAAVPYELLVDESPRDVDYGETVVLDIQVNPPSELELANDISWSTILPFECLTSVDDPCSEIFLAPTESDVVQLRFVDQYGCESIFDIPIFTKIPEYIYVPNVFSPNADGINDVFEIAATDFVVAVPELRIFDRWGGVMFERFDQIPTGLDHWDGFSRGQLVNQGVYVYMIVLELATGEQVILSGDVTVLH